MNIMTGVKACDACRKQVKLKRNGKPHAALTVVEKKEYHRAAPGWDEITYRCMTCGSLIGSTNDPNEIAPFWWFV